MRSLFVSTVLLAAYLLAGCLGAGGAKGVGVDVEASAHAHANATVPDLKDMYIVATDVTNNVLEGFYKFRPAEFKAQVGETLNITIKSAVGNQNPHNLVINELNVRTPNVNAGEAKNVTVKLDKAGTFEYYCSVGNHRTLGMRGTLTVSG